MSQYEYKVVPAPKKGLKTKGAKTSEDRFANALETAINTYAANGWHYLRTDTLPCHERTGLIRRVTTFQNMLVFRRAATKMVERPGINTTEAPNTQKITPSINTTPVIKAKTLDTDPARQEPKVAVQ